MTTLNHLTRDYDCYAHDIPHSPFRGIQQRHLPHLTSYYCPWQEGQGGRPTDVVVVAHNTR